MAATVAGTHLSGNHAGRPAGNTVPDGALYACSTHNLIYVSSYAGNSWSTWATLVAGTLSADNQLFDTAGNTTWTKPAGALFVDVWCVGGGGGGGAGRKGAAGSTRIGGGGGGGGGFSYKRFLASELGATEKLTVGALGAKAAAQTSSDSAGANGSAGGASYFGNSVDGTPDNAKVIAGGGGGGNGGNTTDPSIGGIPGVGNIASRFRQGSSATFAAAADFQVIEGGGGSTAGATARNGNFGYACGGGGGGGSVDSSNNERAGGSGGVPAERGNAWTGAAGGAVHAVGTAGTTISIPDDLAYGGFGGGGGGGSKTAANPGTGGAGGFPGGGGGGGGAGVNAVVDSGAGGDGSKGAVWVVSLCQS